MFKAYFEDAKDLSRHGALVECATSAGLDGNAASAMLASDEFREHVLSKARSWSRQGVSGVPHFVVSSAKGGRPVAFSGAQPAQVIAEVLEEQYDL
mmetsp:Transcript_28444/g.62273  ORF Transcript_28444/g.62273 Transcript_28444/m.62273 type:complete len:96 (+) Transcript_28444:389-676(+)